MSRELIAELDCYANDTQSGLTTLPVELDQLGDAITGKDAFCRFQNELSRHEDQYTRRHRFRDNAQLGCARAWLADHCYRSRHASP